MRFAVSGFIAAAMLALSTDASQAATTTTTFQVTAIVGASCTVSATDMAFGTYNPLSALPASATSTVTVQCTLLSAYTVGLSAGTGAGATVTSRLMTKGADTLGYSLYKDVTHLVVWGDTGGATVSGVGTGLAVPTLIYGLIPALQSINTGAYSDTVTVTVNY